MEGLFTPCVAKRITQLNLMPGLPGRTDLGRERAMAFYSLPSICPSLLSFSLNGDGFISGLAEILYMHDSAALDLATSTSFAGHRFIGRELQHGKDPTSIMSVT